MLLLGWHATDCAACTMYRGVQGGSTVGSTAVVAIQKDGSNGVRGGRVRKRCSTGREGYF